MQNVKMDKTVNSHNFNLSCYHIAILNFDIGFHQQLMGIAQCQQCQSQQLNIDLTAYSPYHTIGEIEEKYRAYAERNMLGFYSVRIQKNIQKLYTLGQLHICDLIISLTCEQRNQIRDKLLDDIQRIDLEQLDHLTLIEVLPKNVQNKYSASSSIYFDEQQKTELASIKTTVNGKNEQNFNHQYGLRIINKYNLKSQLKKQEQFKNNHFFVVGTVGCFEAQNLFTPTSLPTKKSPLRLFLEKVEGVNIRHRTNILVVFIISPECEQQFDKEVAAYEKQVKDDYSDIDEYGPPFLKIQKVIYRPIYPCVDLDRKIQVTASSEEILFNYKDGDLIGFMKQDPVLEGLLQKYEFMQVANISNILQPLADREALGYLAEHVEVDIVAPVVIEDGVKGYDQTLRLNKYFVEKAKLNPKSPIQKHYRLIQSYYIRTQLLTNKGSHFHKLISTRIKSKSLSNQSDSIYFSRTFENILYSPITLLLITTKRSFAPVQKQEVSYSNYCKSILGITDTTQEEIVQICPQILFGSKPQLQSVITKLRNMPSAGFPLVLNRQKVEVRKSHLK